MSELRLGRPLPLTTLDEDETEGLYLDAGTALQENVLGRKPKDLLPKPVEALPEPAAPKATFAFPSSLLDATPSVRGTKVSEPKEGPAFAFPTALLDEAPVEVEKPKGKKDQGDFSRGFQEAVEQTPALAKGMVGYVGAVGEKVAGEGGIFSGLKKWGLEGYQKGMEEISARSKETDQITNAWEKAKGGDLGALVDWAQYGIGQLAGNVAETAITAVLGGTAGAMVGGPAAPVTAGAGAVTGAVGKAATKGFVKNLIEGMVEKEAARIAAKEGIEAGSEAAISAATKTVAKDIGASTALVGSGIIKETGGIYGDAVEQAMSEGRELDAGDLARIFGAGVAAGVTEAVVDRLGLDAAAGRINIPGGGRLGKAFIGGTIGGGIEGGTETIQTALERFGAGKALTGEEALNEYINTFALGALGGGTIGGITGAFRKGQIDKSKLDQYLKEAEGEIGSDDGRQELFDAMAQDPRLAQVLEANGIESADDPRFQEVAVRAIRRQKLLSEFDEIPTDEQRTETRKQRGADIQAAFGDTASTGTGVGTGATEPVLRRDSVVPNEEDRTLEPATPAGIQPVTLPGVQGGSDRTTALSPEDIVARGQGFEVMPTFKVDSFTRANRFVSENEANRFVDLLRTGNVLEQQLIADEFKSEAARDKARDRYNKVRESLGLVAKDDWSAIDPVFPEVYSSDIQIRRGQKSKAAGGGTFYFAESRPSKNPLPVPKPAEAPEVKPAEVKPTKATKEAKGDAPKAPSAPVVGPALPPDLAGAKPRYGAGKTGYTLQFESDVDRALYILAQDRPSSRDADYRMWVGKVTGMNAKQIDAFAKQVKATIKARVSAGLAQDGNLVVKPVFDLQATTQPTEKTEGAPTTDATEKADKAEAKPATETKAETKKGQRTSEDAFAESRAVIEKMDTLRQKNGLPPRSGTAKREQYDKLVEERDRLVAEYGRLKGQEEKKSKDEKEKADRQSRDPDRQAAIEFWEDNDDGKTAHVPFKDLTPQRQAEWIRAHFQKKATAELHDTLVAQQMGEEADLRRSEAKEQSVRGIESTAATVQDLVASVNRKLERAGQPANFSAARVPVGDLVGRLPGVGLIEKTAGLFGKKVVFFRVNEGSPDFFDGAVLPTTTTIFVNVNTSRAHIRIFGHELVHAIRNSDAKTYRKLVQALAPMLDSQGYDAFVKKQKGYGVANDEKILEEAIGDIVGDRFGESEFWQMLADENPSTFKQIAKAVLDFIDSFLAKLTGKQTLGSETLIKDLRQAREQIAAILSDVAPREAARAEDTGYVGRVEPSERRKAERYAEENGILPYVSEGQIEVPVDSAEDPAFSVKAPYTEAQIRASGGKKRNHPVLGLPLNQNGTVTLYFPTTNDDARRVVRERTLKGKEGANRIYLTNESSAAAILAERGNIEQDVGGANILVQVDPDLLQVDEEFESGRRDFFIPIAEGNVFREKMKQTKLFTMNKSRKDGISDFATLGTITEGVTKGIEAYKAASGTERRKLVAKARALLKREHNVGTLLGENGKLEKTRVGEYGLTYEGKSVASMGLGLASAQKINTKNLTTCPKSAACERLCLGETSGQNLLYGGEGDFRSGPRLSQYLKTEAMVINPEAFSIVLADEIAKFRAWANAETETTVIDGKKTKVEKQQYAAAIRLNVTSDFPPKVFRALIEANPDVMFYDYTKLFSNEPIAKNHHLTYSSTGFSQRVGDKVIDNVNSNWPEMFANLLRGKNVAMAFSSRTAIPSFIVDEETGRRFRVWDGDNYDARFLDPKQPDGVGMIIGLTNKDRTGDPAKAAEDNGGFFVDYDPERDGDSVVVPAIKGNLKPKRFIELAVAEPAFSVKADTPEFAKWFRDSQITDGAGSPAVWYHGTARDIEAFMPKQANAIFVTPKPQFAEQFSMISENWMSGNYKDLLTPEQIETAKKEAKQALAADYKGRQLSALRAEIDRGEPTGAALDAFLEAIRSQLPTRANIIPVYVRSEKPFDFAEPTHIDEMLATKAGEDIYPEEVEQIRKGKWLLIEKPHVQRAIREAGFDGFYVVEGGVKNLAVYKPSQLKSVFNRGTWSDEADEISFSRKEYENQFDDLPANVRDMALAKGFASPPTIKDRLDSIKPRLKERIVQGMFDRFRAVKDFSPKAYIMLRMAGGSMDGAVSTLLHYGQVFNDDGALNIRKGTKGLLEVLAPVGGEVDRFLLWIAANRADQLSKQERERFFSPEQIKALKRINLGTMKDGKSRPAVYAEALRQMNELNRSVLDVARQTGLIDDAAYKRFSSDIWYVPFYRQMEEDGSLSGAQTSSGAVGQYLSKSLKGSERPLNDLMENVILNWSHILSASMRNAAAVETLSAASQMGGVVTKVTPLDSERGRTPSGEIVRLKGTVKVMEGGKEMRYRIDDDLVLAALSAVSSIPQYGFFTKLGREFKTMLTRGVSLAPTFKINNLIRDSIQAIGLSELKSNPLTNVMQGLSAYKNDRVEALAAGGLFAMGNAYDGDQTSTIKRLLREGVKEDTILSTPEKAAAMIRKLGDKYDEISDAMENANRLALYKQLREKGVSHLEAAYAARDLQDFSLQGSWPAIRYAAMLLPYFNARLQGMYKLGRDGIVPTIQFLKGDSSQRQKAAKFSTVLGAVTTIGLLLYLAQKDDEEWKKREDWDRDSFFWIRVPGTDTALRIPKPFEMGAFASIIERLTEQMVDDGVEGKVFGKRLLSILSDNLAINPVPQIVRPLEELRRNKSGFTDRPIESEAMRRLSPENRVGPSTSSVAVALGTVNGMFANFVSSVTGASADSMKLSPIQYDHLIRGYLGWLGTAILTTTEMAVSPFKEGESPDRKLDQMFVIGSYLRELPSSQSKYVTNFYENAREISTAVADYKAFVAARKMDEAKALWEDKGHLISMGKFYTKQSEKMADLNKQIKAISADKEMSGEQKRLRIDRLEAIRDEIAKNAEVARIARSRAAD